MHNSRHKLREYYPELVGENTIAHIKRKYFFTKDAIPILVLLFFFIILVFNHGYLKPMMKLNNLRYQIDKTSTYFDARLPMTYELNAKLRERINANSLMKEYKKFKTTLLDVGKGQPRRYFDGQLLIYEFEKIIISLDKEDKELSLLATNKPNEFMFEKRLDAMREYILLSKEIIDNRDIEQYNFLSKEPKKYKSILSQAWNRIKGIPEEDITIDSLDGDMLLDRSKLTIQKAEKHLDTLSKTENRAKELLKMFDEKQLPRREHEVLEHINRQWKTNYHKLLGYWLNSRNLETSLNELEEKVAKFRADKKKYKDIVLEKKEKQIVANELEQRKRNKRKAEKFAKEKEIQEAAKKMKAKAYQLLEKKVKFGGTILTNLATRYFVKKSIDGKRNWYHVKLLGVTPQQRKDARKKALREVCNSSQKAVILAERSSTRRLIVWCAKL